MNDITVHVRAIEGKVVMTFPEPVTHLSMTPDQARKMIALIQDCAGTIHEPPVHRPN